MLKILNVPNKALNLTAKPVRKIDSRIRRLLNDMEKVLVIQDNPPGVGLAAPQVGVSLRIFIIKPTPKAKTEVFINPKVIGEGIIEPKTGGRKPLRGPVAANKPPKNSKLEGCLSIPRIWAPIRRQKTVKLSYLDQKGGEKIATFAGFKAIIIQHEIDHLEGILFTQRALEQSSKIFEEDREGKLKKVDY